MVGRGHANEEYIRKQVLVKPVGHGPERVEDCAEDMWTTAGGRFLRRARMLASAQPQEARTMPSSRSALIAEPIGTFL